MFSMPGFTVISVLASPIFFVATGTAESVPSAPAELPPVVFFGGHVGFASLAVCVEGPSVFVALPLLLPIVFLIAGAAVVVGGLGGVTDWVDVMGTVAGVGDLRSG